MNSLAQKTGNGAGDADAYLRSAGVPSIALRVEKVTAADAAQAPFLADWQALVAKAAEPNAFYEPWNLLPAIQALTSDDAVTLLAVRSDAGLVGLLPIMRSADYYGHPIPHYRVWLHDNAFCGAPLIARGFEEAFWQVLLDWLDSRHATSLLLHVNQMPADSAVTRGLLAALADSKRPATIVRREERALLQSTLDAAAYFEQSMSGKKRKELRRQARRLGELGELRFERQTDAQDIDAWVDAFLTLEHAGWKGREGSSLSSDAANARYFRAALTEGAQAGRLERLSLLLDDRPIAMLATFLAAPGSFSFKTAFDEDYARFSPGVLLQEENLALLDRADIAWCDSCAAADHPMIERIWREKREMIAINIALGGPLRRQAFKLLRRAERSAEPLDECMIWNS